MAVIIPNMEIPESCLECEPFFYEENSTCGLGCFIPFRFEGLHKDCPLKSADDMVVEIETELETLRAINTEQNKASDYHMNFEIANMSGMIGGYVKTLDIIHKYTKE